MSGFGYSGTSGLASRDGCVSNTLDIVSRAGKGESTPHVFVTGCHYDTLREIIREVVVPTRGETVRDAMARAARLLGVTFRRVRALAYGEIAKVTTAQEEELTRRSLVALRHRLLRIEMEAAALRGRIAQMEAAASWDADASLLPAATLSPTCSVCLRAGQPPWQPARSAADSRSPQPPNV